MMDHALDLRTRVVRLEAEIWAFRSWLFLCVFLLAWSLLKAMSGSHAAPVPALYLLTTVLCAVGLFSGVRKLRSKEARLAKLRTELRVGWSNPGRQ